MAYYKQGESYHQAKKFMDIVIESNKELSIVQFLISITTQITRCDKWLYFKKTKYIFFWNAHNKQCIIIYYK